MHRISAALACLAVVVTAGCGTAKATTPGHPAPLPCPRASNVITQADSGKTYCVRVGDQVAIILMSTQKNLWLGPLASRLGFPDFWKKHWIRAQRTRYRRGWVSFVRE